MVDLGIGVLFVVFGINYINLAFRLKRSKDINLIKNNMVKIENIKDKEGYLKFNFKINLAIGITELIYGITFILSKYFEPIKNISGVVSTVMMLSIFVYFYKLIFKAPKFQE